MLLVTAATPRGGETAELIAYGLTGAGARAALREAVRRAGATASFARAGDVAHVTLPGGAQVAPFVAAVDRDARLAGVRLTPTAPVRATAGPFVEQRARLDGGPATDRVPLGAPRFDGRVDGFAPGDARYFALQWYLARAHVPDAWAHARGLSRVTVAVLDTGVAHRDEGDDDAVRHARSPDLEGVRFAAGYDFINRDPWPDDDNQHGTFMASVVAARGGVVGVAPGVRIMPVKVLDRTRAGTELALIDGIRWAVEHGADVINMSLSFPVDYRPSVALRDAVREAWRAGVVMVAAAGNDGEPHVSYPAAFPEVIAVGATRLSPEGGELRDVLATYSNFGAAVDVLAPGGLLDRDVNGDGHPDGVLAMTHAPEDATRFSYWFQMGTSPAAAIVSGVAALLLAAGCAPEAVRDVLADAAAPARVGEGSGVTVGFAGRLDARAALSATALAGRGRGAIVRAPGVAADGEAACDGCASGGAARAAGAWVR